MCCCCAPLLPFSPPLRAHLRPPSVLTHTHTPPTPFLCRDRCWPAIDAQAQEAEGVQRWRHGRPDLLKSFNLSQHIFLEKHSIRTRVHMKRRTLSLSLSFSLCVRMHASARREDLRDFASYFFFQAHETFSRKFRDPYPSANHVAPPATKDEKEYRTRSPPRRKRSRRSLKKNLDFKC